MLITARGNNIGLLGLKSRIESQVVDTFKKENPKKWTYRFIGYLPNCRQIEKGNVPKKWTQEKDNEFPKVDSSEGHKSRKMDIWVFLSVRASDTINDRLERMQ